MGLLDKLSDPYMLMQIMGGVGLLGSKRQSQADKYRDYMTQGLLGYAKDQKEKDKEEKRKAAVQAYFNSGDAKSLFEVPGLESTAATLMTQSAKNRPTSTRKDGVLIYTDTGEPVPGQDNMESPFKTEKDAMDMQMKIQKSFNDQTKPDQKRVGSFDSATQVIRSRGGFENLTGADDTLLMKAFANMLLPNEAVMSDDLNIIAQQSGIPGEIKNLIKRVGGGGQLESSERARIYKTMEDMFYTSMRKMESEKAGLFPMVQQGRFNYNSVFPNTGYPIAADIPQGLLKRPPSQTGNAVEPNPEVADSILDKYLKEGKKRIRGLLQ